MNSDEYCLGQTLETPTIHGAIRCTSFDSTGNFILSGHSKSKVVLSSLSTNSVLESYCGHSQDVLSVHSSTDNHFIVSGSADKSVICWDVSNAKIIRRLCGHRARINGVRYIGSNGIISVSMDTSCCIWDTRKPNALCQTIKHAKDSLTSIDSSEIDRFFVVSCLDGKIYSYDIRNRKVVIDCVILVLVFVFEQFDIF
ncbi:hypothetical protein ACOME3_004220 [Neoechinorhynchus agilis]